MINSRIVEVITPPTMGAAIRFITSAPVPELNMIGIKPASMTLTVIIFGRMRLTAPNMTASRKSLFDLSNPSFFHFS
jgi:hypothetical protein